MCGAGVEFFGDYCGDCEPDGSESGFDAVMETDLHALEQHMADEDY